MSLVLLQNSFSFFKNNVINQIKKKYTKFVYIEVASSLLTGLYWNMGFSCDLVFTRVK